MSTTHLDINNEQQFNDEIVMKLVDNGDWEYTRVGFGEDSDGLYMVDLNDSGEILREKIRLDDRFSFYDVLEEGVAHGVFDKTGDAETCDERWTYNMDNDGDGSWEKFLKVVAA